MNVKQIKSPPSWSRNSSGITLRYHQVMAKERYTVSLIPKLKKTKAMMHYNLAKSFLAIISKTCQLVSMCVKWGSVKSLRNLRDPRIRDKDSFIIHNKRGNQSDIIETVPWDTLSEHLVMAGWYLYMQWGKLQEEKLWSNLGDFNLRLRGKESTCKAGDVGSIPGSERSPVEDMASH